MAVAPHALAAQTALAILRDGGNAIDAMIGAAATIAVVYPHMNSIGGDSFWLISLPGRTPMAIDACGAAASAASIGWYRALGIENSIPFRGGVAANTVAGTVSGWGTAHELSRKVAQGRMPLARLLADAIHYAGSGVPVTTSQAHATAEKLGELRDVPGFAGAFLVNGDVPAAGSLFVQARLAATLTRIAEAGTGDFYRGDLARSLAADLARTGSPLALADLHAHHAMLRNPLRLVHSAGELYNFPPPTQGLVSLLILGMLDELDSAGSDPLGAALVHACVEATKKAFVVRDAHITDPAYMSVAPEALLDRNAIRQLASGIDPGRAAPWGRRTQPGDTIWMGAADDQGRMVSFIQSIYHEFGSGVVLDESGITWQNRGCSFGLNASARNALLPGRKPFHTLNPALAVLSGGRTIAYGTMGGDGQPQTQAAVFTRIVKQGMSVQSALSAPRWLLGRTWGLASDSLKLESRFPEAVVQTLRAMGHDVEMLGAYDHGVGHAGAIVRHPDGGLEGGFDPRSDGAVAAY